MATLIKNGTLITASDTFNADILIENETISLIGKDLQHPNAKIVDATDKLIMPGGVDPHVHLDLPMFGTVSSDDHYTGHKAAAFGGTTTAMDFVSLTPIPLPAGEGLGVRDVMRSTQNISPRQLSRRPRFFPANHSSVQRLANL